MHMNVQAFIAWSKIIIGWGGIFSNIRIIFFLLQWQDMCNRTIYIVSHFPIWIYRHHYHMKRVLERYHHRQNTHTTIETQIRSHSHYSHLVVRKCNFSKCLRAYQLIYSSPFLCHLQHLCGILFFYFFVSSHCAVMQIWRSAIAADASQLVLLVFFSLTFPRPGRSVLFFYSFSCIYLKGA